MQELVSSLPDPIFIYEEQDHLLFTNEPGRSLLQKLERFPDPTGSMDELLRRMWREKIDYLPSSFDETLRFYFDSRPHYFLPRAVFYPGEKKKHRLTLILQDVTKFRLIDEVKTNLVSTVSHEIKTPLTAIQMAISLLREEDVGKLNERQMDLVVTAQNEASRLLRILQDLLDMARMEEKIDKLDLAEIPLHNLIERAKDELSSIIAAKKIAVAIHIPLALPPARVDEKRMGIVFRNLLGNALKYTPDGGKIIITASFTHENNISVSFIDQGPGIPEAERKRIFDKFYRAPGQTEPGSGLGLTIAKQIILAHGGLIGCKAGLKQGSEFFIVLSAGNSNL
jgi:two-component system, NtrC family, sensor histidine kinase KinB